MTLSVLEGNSFCKPFLMQYFVFMMQHAVPLHLQSFLLYVYFAATHELVFVNFYADW